MHLHHYNIDKHLVEINLKDLNYKQQTVLKARMEQEKSLESKKVVVADVIKCNA